MVQHPEAEDAVQGAVPVGQAEDVPHIEGDAALLLRVQVGQGLPDHAPVQVQGVERRRLKFLQDEAGPGAPPAAHFQDFGLPGPAPRSGRSI